MVSTNDADLAEDLVEVSLVRKERDYHEDREQEESHNCFPEINFVLGIKRIWLKLSLPTLVYRAADHQDDHDPEVGEDGEEGGDDEDREGLDPPDLSSGHPGDADGRDGKKIEWGWANNGARTEFFRFKIVSNDSDHCQKNLRGRRSYEWQHKWIWQSELWEN